MDKIILVVDDSPSVRQIIKFCLEEIGHTVIVASNGVEALALLKTTRVHLIISDVNMPNMDGLTFAAEVKKSPAHASTPFIMLTTEASDHMKKWAKEVGIKAWLVKPFKAPLLKTAVSRIL